MQSFLQSYQYTTMQRPTYGKVMKPMTAATKPNAVVRGSLQPRAPVPNHFANRMSTTTPVRKNREVLLSTDPLFAQVNYLKTLQTMETKPRIEFKGILGRVFNNKDVEIDLVNTAYQEQDAPNDSATDQLLAAGLQVEFLEAVAGETHSPIPEGVYFPVRVLADGTWRVKAKAAVPDLLSSIRDEEADYGYARDILVRAVVVPRMWKMNQNQTCGFVFDIVQLEKVL